MRITLLALLLVPLIAACNKKPEERVITPVLNQDTYTREMSCDNQPALIKECIDASMCGKFGQDRMNRTFCEDECRAKIKKQCRKPKAAAQQPYRITAPLPLQQTPTPSAVRQAPKPNYPAPRPPLAPAPMQR